MIFKFLKKYPMTIMLAIIAANLISISYSQKQIAKMDKYREECIKYEITSYQRNPEEKERMKTKISKLVKVPLNKVSGFCNYLRN